MADRAGIHAVRNFWGQVWQAPQNYDAIYEFVVENFVLISGGKRIDGREAFKQWAKASAELLSNQVERNAFEVYQQLIAE
jgi:hypothetical protein